MPLQKQDPTQFLRIHAAPCKINLDPAVAVAAEGPGTMWVVGLPLDTEWEH